MIEECLTLLCSVDDKIEEIKNCERNEISDLLKDLTILWAELLDNQVSISNKVYKLVEEYRVIHSCSTKKASSCIKNKNEGILLSRIKAKIRGVEKIMSSYRNDF